MSTVADIKKLADSFERLWSHVSPYSFSSNDRETTARMGFKMLVTEGLHNNSAAITGIYPGIIQDLKFGTQTIKRRVALQHPDFPALYANEINGSAKGSTTSKHEKWLFIEVGFKALPFAVDDGRPYIRISRRGFISEQPIDKRGALIGGQPVSFDVMEVVPGCSHTFTVYQSQISDDQFSSLIQAQHSVNDGTFFGLDRGTVMFTKIDSDEEIKTDNQRSVNYTLQLDASYRDWNMMRGPNGTLQYLYVAGEPRYPYMNFDSLFY